MSCKKKAKNLLLLNAGSSVASYMTIVVMALYINQFLSIRKTAIIIAIPSLMRLFSGVILPILNKRIKVKKLGALSILLNVVVYMMYPIGSSFVFFLLLSIINGVAESIYQPTMKYMFSSIAETTVETDYVHKVRYYSICIAGLIGPLIGGVINSLLNTRICFLCAAGIEMLMLMVYLGFVPDEQNREEVSQIRTKDYCNDKILIGYLLSGFMVFFVFSQFETVYSLALKDYFKNTELIYSILLCLNSLFGIILQTIMIRKKVLAKVGIGIIFFEFAFMIFAISFGLKLGLVFYILGVLVYTFAEVSVIPGLDIQIDEYADEQKKMDYFAFAEVRTIGFVLGPIFLGWALDSYNAVFICIISIVVLMFAQAINIITERAIKSL